MSAGIMLVKWHFPWMEECIAHAEARAWVLQTCSKEGCRRQQPGVERTAACSWLLGRCACLSINLAQLSTGVPGRVLVTGEVEVGRGSPEVPAAPGPTPTPTSYVLYCLPLLPHPIVITSSKFPVPLGLRVCVVFCPICATLPFLVMAQEVSPWNTPGAPAEPRN